MTNSNISKYKFVSQAYSGLGEHTFDVVSFEGEEELGRAYKFELVLSSKIKGLDLQKIFHCPAKLMLHTDTEDRSVIYNGVIAELEPLHGYGDYHFYRVVLVPEIWKLSLIKASRFYKKENQNILDVMRCVFNSSYENGSPYLRNTNVLFFKSGLSAEEGKYVDRDFVLQYDESYLNFLARWMEKEGIYYEIQSHDGDYAVDMQLWDDISQVNVSDSNLVKITLRDFGENPLDARDTVHSFFQNFKSLPQSITLRDYNREQASVPLNVNVVVDEDGFGCIDIFGENFRTFKEGEHYARVHADLLKYQASLFKGKGTAAGIKAGKFVMYDMLGGSKYFVTKVKHKGSQAAAIFSKNNCAEMGLPSEDGYYCEFDALPYEIAGRKTFAQFRCEKNTSKPVVSGNLTAFIKGLSGDDTQIASVCLDEDGRYLVGFQSIPVIDTDSGKEGEDQFIKLRLSTPYAGVNHGMHFPLIDGVEVLVSFTNGDPDLPVIVGAINNSLSPSLSNNDNQLNFIKTPSGNQLTLSDAPDSRGITLAVPSIKNKASYDFIQTMTPSSDSEESLWIDVVSGRKLSSLLGSEFSVNAGIESSISASLSSGISLATSVEMFAGISNSINLGEMGVNWSPAIPGLNKICKYTSLNLGDGGESLSFGDDKKHIETNQVFSVKTSPIDEGLEKPNLKLYENALKGTLSTLLAGDVVASYLLKMDSESKNEKIEEEYRVKYNSAYKKYKYDISKTNNENEKIKLHDIFEKEVKEALDDRNEELKKLYDDYDNPNHSRKRFGKNIAHLAAHAAAQGVLLGQLALYGRNLKKYKESIEFHKNKFLMSDDHIYIKRTLKNNIFSSIKFTDNGIFIDVEKMKNSIKIDFNSEKNTVSIDNKKFKIEMKDQEIYLGNLSNSSFVKVMENEVLVDSQAVKINNMVDMKSGKGSFFQGVLEILGVK